ncbi:hypothetical protein PENTCL1PPCAC_21780, partial [Pristionchus entomophagus]
FQTSEMILVKFTGISKLTAAHVFSQWSELAGLNWSVFTLFCFKILLRGVRSNSFNESCSAFVNYQLISQKKESIVYRNNAKKAVEYTQIDSTWGYNQFISFKDLIDEEKGYLKDDSIIVSAVIKAFPNA